MIFIGTMKSRGKSLYRFKELFCTESREDFAACIICGIVCTGEEIKSFVNTGHFGISGLKLEISQWFAIYSLTLHCKQYFLNKNLHLTQKVWGIL